MQKMPFFHSENVNQNKTCFKSEIWKRASESLLQILFNDEFQVKKQCDILQFPEKCGALSPHFSLFGGHFGSKMAARGHWSEKNCIFEKGSPRPFKWYMICYAMLNISISPCLTAGPYLNTYSLNCKVRHREVRKTAKFGRFFIWLFDTPHKHV